MCLVYYNLMGFVSWLSNPCPYQLIFQGRRFPVSDHEISLSKIFCGTGSAQICPIFRDKFFEIGVGSIVCCNEHKGSIVCCNEHRWHIISLTIFSIQ